VGLKFIPPRVARFFFSLFLLIYFYTRAWNVAMKFVFRLFPFHQRKLPTSGPFFSLFFPDKVRGKNFDIFPPYDVGLSSSLPFSPPHGGTEESFFPPSPPYFLEHWWSAFLQAMTPLPPLLSHETNWRRNLFPPLDLGLLLSFLDSRGTRKAPHISSFLFPSFSQKFGRSTIHASFLPLFPPRP